MPPASCLSPTDRGYVLLQCDGFNGQYCSYHGRPYLKQLSKEQKVAAIARVIELDPVPYRSEALLDWCLEYLHEHWHPNPGHVIPAALPHVPLPPSMASLVAVQAPMHMTWRSTSHDMRYQGWVTSLIPGLPAGGNNHGPSCV